MVTFNCLKKMKSAKLASLTAADEDRLSSLPDAILVDILSRLEIQKAVVTSVLSHRWVGLWKGVDQFRLGYVHFDNGIPIIRTLRQLTSPKMYVFEVNLKHMNFDLLSAARSCQELICRGVEQILINSYAEPNKVFFAPRCLFEIPSLVILHLCCWVKLPNVEPDIWFPNLKTLHLDALTYLPSWFGTLIRCSPVLEHFYLRIDIFLVPPHRLPDLEIFSPNLKSLHIRRVNYPNYNPGINVFIYAPCLTKIQIVDYTSSYFFVNEPSTLIEAVIESNEDDLMSKFVAGMSSVHELRLDLTSEPRNQINICIHLHSLNQGSLSLIFPNLVSLRMSFDGKDLNGWRDLLLSLHCFPNLNYLEADMRSNNSPLESGDWCAPVIVPPCFGTKLKKIKMASQLNLNDKELKLLAYILRNAIVLEKLCASVYTDGLRGEVQLWKARNFCKSLFSLPKASKTCEILFSNPYVKASSTEFKNGRLTCELLRF